MQPTLSMRPQQTSLWKVFSITIYSEKPSNKISSSHIEFNSELPSHPNNKWVSAHFASRKRTRIKELHNLVNKSMTSNIEYDIFWHLFLYILLWKRNNYNIVLSFSLSWRLIWIKQKAFHYAKHLSKVGSLRIYKPCWEWNSESIKR